MCTFVLGCLFGLRGAPGFTCSRWEGPAYQGCPWVYESVLTGDVVLLPLLGFNYWFMYLSKLGDLSLISNWRWVSRHVYIPIFLVLLLHYCMCFVVWLCSYSFSPSWLGFWHCPWSFHNPCQYRKPGGLAHWCANLLVWHNGAQIERKANCRFLTWLVFTWLDSSLLNLSCRLDFSLLDLTCFCLTCLVFTWPDLSLLDLSCFFFVFFCKVFLGG